MPLRMGGGQAFGKLPGDRPRLPDRQWTLRDGIAERAPLDELHGNPRQAVALADVVDGDDGRMVERRGGACFGFEAPAAGLVTDQPLGNHLERNGATEPRIEAAVDLTHSAFAQLVQDAVGTKRLADHRVLRAGRRSACARRRPRASSGEISPETRRGEGGQSRHSSRCDSAASGGGASAAEEVLHLVGPKSIAGDQRHGAPMMARDGRL